MNIFILPAKPDAFSMRYERWLVTGSQEEGWSAGKYVGYNWIYVGARGVTLDVMVVALRRSMRAELPGQDTDDMEILLDMLIGVNWGWPIKVETAVELNGSTPTFLESEQARMWALHAEAVAARERARVNDAFEWIGNTREDAWLLFVRGAYVGRVQTAEKRRAAWPAIRDLFERRIGRYVPEHLLLPIMRALDELAFPGAPNETAGPCRDCGGRGLAGPHQLQRKCPRCGGRGDDVNHPYVSP